MMKTVLLSLMCSSAVAFTSRGSSPRTSVAVNGAMDDLKAVAAESNPVLKFYDPLELSSTTIWENTNEESIGFLRHAEIKHGRVAMAAFVGYIVQSNGILFPWKSVGGNVDFSGLSPPEQWDAMPEAAKFQIILFVGFLEFIDESTGTHYMRGGKAGEFPSLKDSVIPHPVPFNLFDPFGFSDKRSEVDKQKGLICELNNGRLAMIGIMSFLAEQKVDGAVPLLKGVVPHYAGEPMAPFIFESI